MNTSYLILAMMIVEYPKIVYIEYLNYCQITQYSTSLQISQIQLFNFLWLLSHGTPVMPSTLRMMLTNMAALGTHPITDQTIEVSINNCYLSTCEGDDIVLLH